MKVLYVEDNPANVFLVKRVARMGQHEIINYIDGDQAIQKFKEINPDLVLMDIQLAGDKSGLDVVKELRQLGVKTPIIAVTAYAMVGDKERCIAAGCTDYLAKPLPIPRLVEIFKHYSDIVEAKSSATEVPTQTAPVEAPIKETETVESTVVTPKEIDSAEATKTEQSSTTETVDEKETATSPAVDDDSSQDSTLNSEIMEEPVTPSNVNKTVDSKTEQSSTTETATSPTVDDDSSQDSTLNSKIMEEPVTPSDVSKTVDSKEEVSTRESL